MASAEFHELVKKSSRPRPREENPTIEQLRAGFAALSRQFPPSASATFEPVNASGVPAEWVSVAVGQAPSGDPLLSWWRLLHRLGPDAS